MRNILTQIASSTRRRNSLIDGALQMQSNSNMLINKKEYKEKQLWSREGTGLARKWRNKYGTRIILDFEDLTLNILERNFFYWKEFSFLWNFNLHSNKIMNN